MPSNNTTGHNTTGPYDALGYYPAPADGDLLGGPVSTSPKMTTELCETTCQGYPYMALENGIYVRVVSANVLDLTTARR